MQYFHVYDTDTKKKPHRKEWEAFSTVEGIDPLDSWCLRHDSYSQLFFFYHESFLCFWRCGIRFFFHNSLLFLLSKQYNSSCSGWCICSTLMTTTIFNHVFMYRDMSLKSKKMSDERREKNINFLAVHELHALCMHAT